MATPQSMASLAAEAASTELEQFRRRHGEAFLMFTGQQSDLRRAAREWQATLGHGGRKVGGTAPQRLTTMLVYSVRSTAEPWVVTVGRVEPNDVVLPDDSVSVYHALFKKGRGGRVFVQDAGSKNGTYVNEAEVPHKDAGAMEVRSSNTVRFGSVVTTFLLCAELVDLARTLSAVTAGQGRAATPTPPGFIAGPATTGKVPLSDNMLAYFDAVQYVQSRRYRSAQILLRGILARDPGDRDARLWLELAAARELAQRGDVAGAARRYRAVLALDPYHEEARAALQRSGR